MMTVNSLRMLFVLICCTSGYFTGAPEHRLQGIALGFLLSMVAFAMEFIIRKVAIRDLVAGIVGLFGGLILAMLCFAPVAYFLAPGLPKTVASVALFLMMSYLGIILAIKKKDELFLWRSRVHGATPEQEQGISPKILDTSVIIDGRIADICQTQFLDGVLIIPRFVLAELQQVADSTDPLKRNRGRRGLETLSAIQKSNAFLEICDQDYPHITEVDAKLVELARDRKAKILTTDFNLNKVAELQGIGVLNINDLSNAIKPVVIPGEEMSVKVIKEGKEQNQGLAYLDDGTMIVVENGKAYMNQTLSVVITSVLQTAAGRMIFARKKT